MLLMCVFLVARRELLMLEAHVPFPPCAIADYPRVPPKIAVITASLGSFERQTKIMMPQALQADYFCFTDDPNLLNPGNWILDTAPYDTILRSTREISRIHGAETAILTWFINFGKRNFIDFHAFAHMI
jgi:hypothetical protein